MIAAEVRETELADYQRAVRTLLVHPLVTASTPDRAALALVRRFAPQLTEDLASLAGYRLELTATCARLIRPVDRLDPTQRVGRRRDGAPFDRRRIAYLSLVLAALGRAGTQVALTELAAGLTRRAAEIDGLGFDPDQYRHRLAFVDVVRSLLDLGGLREVEVSAADWLRDPDAGEALYDVDREVIHLVAVPPRVLQHVTSVRSLLAEDGERQGTQTTSVGARRAATRRRLVRLLLEHPVVHADDLDERSRTYLVQQGRALADDLHRLTGAQLERRAEGAALIDATGGFTDQRFPTGGTASQVALLLADAMAAAVVAGVTLPTATVPTSQLRDAELIDRLDRARPDGPRPGTELGLLADGGVRVDADLAREADAGAGADAGPEVGADADDDALLGAEPDAPLEGEVDADADVPVRPPAQGPLFTDAWVLEQVTALCATHGARFAAHLRQDPPGLATAAVDVLAAFDLVRRVPGGIVARPVLARYRDLVVHVAEPAQPSLLDLADPGPAPGNLGEDAAPDAGRAPTTDAAPDTDTAPTTDAGPEVQP